MTSQDEWPARWLAALDARRAGQAPSDAVAGGTPPGFDVYVNTGLRALVDALAANFPAVAHHVGDARFRALALQHARRHPATDARLFLYGEQFADHLRRGELHADAERLATLAELDRGWTLAHAAIDARPLDHRHWAGQSPHALAAGPLQLAPARFWLSHPTQPIWDLWTQARAGQPSVRTRRRRGQAVLLTRPHDAVLSCEIDTATGAFLRACRQGAALADAAAAALHTNHRADLQALLARLFTQGAFAEADFSTPPPADTP